MTSNVTLDPTTATLDRRPPARRIWRNGAVAGAAATAVNLVLFLAARLAGTSFVVRFTGDADPTTVTALQVVAATIVAVVIGLGVASFASRFPRGPWIVAAVGAFVALASAAVPMGLQADIGARLALAAMHVVVGGAFVAAIATARRT